MKKKIMTKGLAESHLFYQDVLRTLGRGNARCLVGGAFAMASYAGVYRDTKDLDIFCLPQDCDRIIQLCANAGYKSHVVAPHWLGKVYHKDYFVDVIFSSGNGLCEVDEDWFKYATPATLFNMKVQLIPVEEMIWSKGFIMERHRFDGGDIAHLLRARAQDIDWERLAMRFGQHWRVLLAHLNMFGYIYPDKSAAVPPHLMDWLAEKLKNDQVHDPKGLCRGTFLSIFDYAVDVNRWGSTDARLPPTGRMTPRDIDMFGPPPA